MFKNRAFPSLPNPDQGRVRGHLAKLRSLPIEFYDPPAARALPAEYFAGDEVEFRPRRDVVRTESAGSEQDVPALPVSRGIMA